MVVRDEEIRRCLGAFRGKLVMPDDSGYEAARRVWNGCIDRRPAAVARCAGGDDVVAVVRAAQELDLPLAVRGGGHSLPGFSTVDGGLVLDLSELTEVGLDVDRRVARVGGGARWADVDEVTHKNGLATTGGLVSSTGVGGFTLGGGIGWLTRLLGLACDNLVAATLVTADGDVRRVDADSDAELLWALRGGGGNFGVVTTFELQLHPLTDVTGGLLLWPAARAGEVGAAYRDWTSTLPDTCTTMLVALTAPDLPEIPATMRGGPAAGVAVCHAGDDERARADLARLLALGPVEMVERQPYPQLQSMFDADLPAGRRYYFSGLYLRDCDDAAIETVTHAVAAAPSPGCEIDLHHMGGAAGRVPPTATAFSGRDAAFVANIYASWDDRADDDSHREWARGVVAALRPQALPGAYVNFQGDVGDARDSYGAQRYQRLVEVKRRLDPGNLFRLNQNIAP